jgi:phosphomannomutase
MDSPYHTKTGQHYEERVGMVNFSIVGRNATMTQRKEYASYDKLNNERVEIVEKLKNKYKKLDFVVGGAVSIDIFQIGDDKSQIVSRYFKDMIETSEIIFVGDRITYPGNDHTLARVLNEHKNGRTIEIESWKDTARLLDTDLFASG